MIIENVNGEARQVFDFSKPDALAKFYAPVRVGAGYRRRIEIAKARGVINDPKYLRMALKMFEGRKKPNGMPDADWTEQIQMEVKDIILGDIQAEDLNSTPDENLAVLETLLTPAPGSMDVKLWYEEYADESEVEQVINFSLARAESKIEAALRRPKSGKGTKRKAKADL